MKMTREEADEIRRVYFAGGVTQDKLAVRFKRGRRTIAAILRDEIWTDKAGGSTKVAYSDNTSVERGICKDSAVWESLLYSPKLGQIAQ